jgi:hypothetical protein
MMLSQTVAQASRRRTNLSRRDGGESAETPDDDVFIASSTAAATLVEEIISDTGFLSTSKRCFEREGLRSSRLP